MTNAVALKSIGTITIEEAFSSFTTEDFQKELESVYICSDTGAYLKQFYKKHFVKKDAQFSKLFIDANGLKKINDTQGHNAGDRYIKGIAETCQQFTRSEDILFRWGGDEFIMFIKSNNLNTVNLVKERLEKTLESRGLSAALGVGSTIEEADRQMYADKKIKKSLPNRVKNYVRNVIKLVDLQRVI